MAAKLFGVSGNCAVLDFGTGTRCCLRATLPHVLSPNCEATDLIGLGPTISGQKADDEMQCGSASSNLGWPKKVVDFVTRFAIFVFC